MFTKKQQTEQDQKINSCLDIINNFEYEDVQFNKSTKQLFYCSKNFKTNKIPNFLNQTQKTQYLNIKTNKKSDSTIKSLDNKVVKKKQDLKQTITLEQHNKKIQNYQDEIQELKLQVSQLKKQIQNNFNQNEIFQQEKPRVFGEKLLIIYKGQIRKQKTLIENQSRLIKFYKKYQIDVQNFILLLMNNKPVSDPFLHINSIDDLQFKLQDFKNLEQIQRRIDEMQSLSNYSQSSSQFLEYLRNFNQHYDQMQEIYKKENCLQKVFKKDTQKGLKYKNIVIQFATKFNLQYNFGTIYDSMAPSSKLAYQDSLNNLIAVQNYIKSTIRKLNYHVIDKKIDADEFICEKQELIQDQVKKEDCLKFIDKSGREQRIQELELQFQQLGIRLEQLYYQFLSKNINEEAVEQTMVWVQEAISSSIKSGLSDQINVLNSDRLIGRENQFEQLVRNLIDQPPFTRQQIDENPPIQQLIKYYTSKIQQLHLMYNRLNQILKLKDLTISHLLKQHHIFKQHHDFIDCIYQNHQKNFSSFFNNLQIRFKEFCKSLQDWSQWEKRDAANKVKMFEIFLIQTDSDIEQILKKDCKNRYQLQMQQFQTELEKFLTQLKKTYFLN